MKEYIKDLKKIEIISNISWAFFMIYLIAGTILTFSGLAFKNFELSGTGIFTILLAIIMNIEKRYFDLKFYLIKLLNEKKTK